MIKIFRWEWWECEDTEYSDENFSTEESQTHSNNDHYKTADEADWE